MSLDYNLLLETVKHGNLKLLRGLLKIPKVAKQIDANNNCALQLAAENGHAEVVKLLKEVNVSKL